MLFLVALFFIKNKTVFKNQANQEGLAFGNETLESQVNKDTDGDGILDWEETLWGTNPLKKDTNDNGTGDDVEVAKMKAAQGMSVDGEMNLGGENTETLTETDKFAREFFSTVATLNQAGEIDQTTIDKLGQSLNEHIQNTPPRKIFLLSELQIAKDDSKQAVTNYANALNNIQIKSPANYTVIDVLQKFFIDENNVDINALSELDLIVENMSETVAAMVKISVPQSLATQHLAVVNILEKILENIGDIRLYESDTIVALSAIAQYESNTTIMESSIDSLFAIIQQKLSN